MDLYSPWNSPDQNTGVGSLSLLQGGLPNPGIEPRSPTVQADSLPVVPCPTKWRIAKSIMIPATRGSSPGCQPTARFTVVGVAKKDYSHRHCMEWCFIHLENRQSKTRFSSVGQSPVVGMSYPMAGRWSACTLLVLQAKDPVFSQYNTHAWAEKRVHIQPRTGKDSPKWAYEGSLSPLKEML